MKPTIVRLLTTACAAAATTVVVMAFSTGPPIKRTGAAVDGGTDCSACHRTFAPANSDPRGKVTIITAGTYAPGVKQNIDIKIEHPEAIRWGFQLTARPVNDLTKMAGTFTVVDGVIRVECNPSGDSPCNGDLEFASHRAAVVTAPNGSYTYTVEWTPPINEVGDVMFYAAGNAANNNAANSGDYIFTTSLRIAAGGACNQTVKPTVRTVSNGASFNNTLAPNTMASVFGLNFAVAGRSRLAGAGDFVAGAFPKELECVAVEIGGKRAAIAYVQSDQINFQVPTLTGTGPMQATVIVNPGRPNELRADVATVTLTNYAPAFFTFNGKSIAALTSDFKILADTAVVTGGLKAKPGDTVLLYGTGFGVTDPVYQAGEIPDGLTKITNPYTITIGGTTLAASDIQYAGIAPQSISGLFQFNVKIPASAANGDLPVVITIGGVSTQSGATIPVLK